MPTNASAKKRIRSNARKARSNSDQRNALRTAVKKVEAAIASGDSKAAQAALKAVQPKLARNAGKGIVKKNTAARKMSRLNARVKKIAKA